MALIVTLLPADNWIINSIEQVQAAEVQLSNPRFIESEYWQLDNEVTWDCVWFGTYPQTEITSADGDIYTKLRNAAESEWENNDITIDGVNYRRMNGYETVMTFTSYMSDQYHWTDSLDTYHYFRYEPIKWLVLQVEGNKAFLLADSALDCQRYAETQHDVVWENCELRSWLNGYPAETNYENIDYTQENFINRAFDQSEQAAILTTTVVNEDNLEYGTDAGNDTLDKIYLLSERELTDAKYGFDDLDDGDTARKATCISDYAMQRGSSIRTRSGSGGNEAYEIEGAKWWTRTPGRDPYRVRDVYEWGMIKKDALPASVSGSVRPCLYLDLTQTSVYAYAGTVRRDGNAHDSYVNEVTAPNLWAMSGVTVQQLPTASAITYGQTLSDSILSGGKVMANGRVIAGTWRFTDITPAPSVSDSNSTEYEVVFYPKDWKRYHRITAKVKVTVNKAIYPPDYPCAQEGSSDMRLQLYESYVDGKTVGNISLEGYPNWEWSAGSKNIPLEENSEIIATAEYVGADKNNYSALTADIRIVVTECTHNFKITETTEPTCQLYGSMTYTCSACNVSYRVANPNKPRVECVYEYNAGLSVAGDCVTDKVTVESCKWCGKSRSEVVKCKGHEYGSPIYTAATCYVAGSINYPCKNCSYVQVNEIPALNHRYELEESSYKASTCTATGYAKSICRICNRTEEETIAAKGHAYDTVDTNATCTTDGNKVETCTREGCGHVATTVLPATGHTITAAWTEKKATCTEDGLEIEYCSTCKKNLQTTILAKGHQYEVIVSPATTEEDGYVLKRCKANCEAAEMTNISRIASVELSKTKYTYDGKTKTPSVVVTDNKGNTLKKDTDYTVSYSSGRKKAGSYTVTVTFKGNYKGTVKKKFTISKQTISKSSVTLSVDTYTYNGKKRTPSVTVTDAQGNVLKKNTHYTVSYSSGRKKVGNYTVTIKMKGNYKGTIKKTFTIVPKSTSLSKLTAQKKGFKVTWKKQTSQVTGYQIQYSTSSKFTKKTTKTITIKSNKTTSQKVSKLKAKKKYYVRVRTYKTVKVNGKTVKLYSSWSKVKSVKTKK